MVDYKNTKIYYIQVGDKRYYGHSAQKYLSSRETKHKQAFNNSKYAHRKVYKAMLEIGMKKEDIKCVFVESFPCANVEEARKRERYWVEQDGELNTTMPSRTRQEYRTQSPAYEREKEQRRVKYSEDDLYRQEKNAKLCEYNKKKWETDEEWRMTQLARNSKFYKERWENDEEWRQKRLENNRERYKKNAERYNQRGKEVVKCDACGKHLTRQHLSRHQKNHCKGKIS